VISIAQLTVLDLRRRRIVGAALAGGLTWLVVFAIAVRVIHPGMGRGPAPLLETSLQKQLLMLAGLSAANLLVMAVAIIVPLDCLSGEIASGVMQTVASKPVSRCEIVLGKWLVFCAVLVAYVTMIVTGVALSMRLIAGFMQPNLGWAIGLMSLEACVLLSVVMAGGVRFSTVANGLVAFAFYAVAIVGGWIEQIGALTGSPEAHYIGVVISLVSPADALWRRAEHLLEPPLLSQLHTVFSSASVPTAAMVWWAGGFALAAMLSAMRGFERREL